MVDGVKSVDRAALIGMSMGASRRWVKKREVISQSLAVHPFILAADDKVVDPVGKWNCEYVIGGQQRT